MCDQVERFALELDVFCHADRAQTRDHRLRSDAAEIESLATRVNCFGDFLRIGRAEDENHMRRRLFERLEERVERRRREHVNLVDDVNLVAPARRRELYAADDLLAHILDARAARSVELVHVGMRALGDQQAVATRAVGIGSGALLAQQGFGQQASRCGLTGAAWAGEQVGVRDFVLLDRIFQRPLDGLLSHDVFEYLRTISTV